jgi:hypothetical protein
MNSDRAMEMIKEFILKGTINNTVPFLRDGFFLKDPGHKNPKVQGFKTQDG